MGPVTASATPPPWRSASTPRSSAGDGQAACDQLNEETASKLEQQEKKPCEQAILTLKLPKGGTVAVRAWRSTSAFTPLAEGARDFLDEGPDGLEGVGGRVQARRAPDQPYDCELEG